MLTFFDYAPALGATILWALSAQVVNRGIASIRSSRGDRVLTNMSALLFALIAGLVTIWAVAGWADPFTAISWPVFLAGIFTFPVGTGLYYLCSTAFGTKAELAAQFANIKPALSIAFGVLLFGEILDTRGAVTFGLILTGIAIILASAWRRRAGSLQAIWLGLALAMSWSVGEVFIFTETGGHASLPIALAALASSLAVTCGVTALYVLLRTGRPVAEGVNLLPLWPVAVHGILSFGFAYALFFHSIRTIGLSNTIIVTTAWPVLSLAIGFVRARMKGEVFTIEIPMLAAICLFAIASLGFVLSGLV